MAFFDSCRPYFKEDMYVSNCLFADLWVEVSFLVYVATWLPPEREVVISAWLCKAQAGPGRTHLQWLVDPYQLAS